MTYTADPRIDAYIAALPGWQQAVCTEVRELVHTADPDVSETIKRTRYPYFVLEGNIAIASSNPLWDIVSTALGAMPPAAGVPKSRK